MKKVTIKLPENKDEISIGTYLKLIELENDLSLTSKERVFATIQAVYNITLEQAKQINVKDVLMINEHFLKVLSKQEERKIIPAFEYRGLNYGMIPNLDEISLAEYIDLEESENDPLQSNIFLNVMYRQIKESAGGKHTIVAYDDSETIDFSDLPLSVLERAKVFFYTLGTQLLSSIEMRSMSLIQMLQQKKENFIAVGDGTAHYTKLQKEISQNLTAYWNKMFMQFFNLSNLRGALTDLKEKELTL